MNGKEKCKILKEIRAEIARANEIEWSTEECTHTGDCLGTCSYCEAEVKKLEEALEERRAMGKPVILEGLYEKFASLQENLPISSEKDEHRDIVGMQATMDPPPMVGTLPPISSVQNGSDQTKKKKKKRKFWFW